jgi:hypothetical protein
MIAVCVCCGKPVQLYKHFTAGAACRSCVLSATRIYAIFEINGVRFREELKTTRPALAGPKKQEVMPKC